MMNVIANHVHLLRALKEWFNMFELQQVSKFYPQHRVPIFYQTTCCFSRHSFNYVGGSSQCGKTTLMKLLLGQEKSNSGEVLFEGQGINHSKKQIADLRRQTSWIAQEPLFLSDQDVWSNLVFPLKLRKLKEPDFSKAITSLAEKLGLTAIFKQPLKQTTPTERQLLSIARAFATNPKVILADEPTQHLSTEQGRQVLKFLYDAHKQGVTIIIVSQQIYSFWKLKPNFFIKQGKIIANV